MIDVRKIPKRRFREFIDDGAWEQCKLGDEAIEIVAGGDIDKNKIRGKGKYPVLANALTNDGIIGYYESEYRIKSPAVTVTGRGDVGHAQARKVDFTPVVRLLSVSSNHDVDFLENAINTLEIMVESTGVPQLTVPQLAKYELFFPTSKDEEIAIGSFFTRINNLITLQQRKLEKVKNLKSAYLSKMFPKEGEKYPELRFAGFTDAWEQRRLGDVIVSELKGKAKAEMLGTKSKYLEANYLNGGKPNYVDCLQDVNKEDVLILWDGSQAGTVYHGFKGALGSTLKAYKPKVSGGFLYQFMRKEQDIIFEKYRTPNIPHVIKTFTEEFYVPFPSAAEQREISIFFSSLDTLITLQQRKLEKLKGIKQAYLNEMFV